MDTEIADKPNKPKPLINDFYWFEISKDLVDKAPDRINDSSQRFEKLILWLWGTYTPIIGLGSGGLALLNKVDYSKFTISLLLMPCFVLLIAYWLATKAQSSFRMEFEPRSPDSIRDAYMFSLQEKGRYYRWSQLLTLAACAFVPLAILLSNISKEDKVEVSIELNKEIPNQIEISGKIPGKQEVDILINSENKRKIKLIDSKFNTFVDSRDYNEKRLEVSIEWLDGELKQRLTRTLK